MLKKYRGHIQNDVFSRPIKLPYNETNKRIQETLWSRERARS